MRSRGRISLAVGFVAGAMAGVVAVQWAGHLSRVAQAAPVANAAPAGAEGVDVASLRAEVERLKTIVPDQSHAMKDVDYHFTNLWFAGQAQNWPLADFYWKETLAHLHWAVRIIPVRKDNAGREIKLAEILQAIEMTPTMQMGDVIRDRNRDKFEPTYRAILEGCHLCHKAADKPYLRPVPERPATSLINFDPKATWPN